jgi:hypothetical protein
VKWRFHVQEEHATETVQAPVSVVVELVAALSAVSSLTAALVGGQGNARDEFWLELAWRNATEIFGVGWGDVPTDPVCVAIEVRSDEITAEVLEGFGEAGRRYRENALRMREAGTTQVPSPWMEER